MKKWVTAFGVLILVTCAAMATPSPGLVFRGNLIGSVGGVRVTGGAATPSGACVDTAIYIKTNGTVYACASATWSAIANVSSTPTFTSVTATTLTGTLSNINTQADAVLSSTASVNLNTATATTLYTCPSGKTCVVTAIVVKAASTSLTTVSFSVGWNSTAFNNVVADATHTELTGSTLYTKLVSKAGATLGTSTGVLKLLDNTLQGGAATATVDVIGYVY